MRLPGTEFFRDPTLGVLERWYCRLLGIPIIGLRIRLRRLSKLLPADAKVVLDAGRLQVSGTVTKPARTHSCSINE